MLDFWDKAAGIVIIQSVCHNRKDFWFCRTPIETVSYIYGYT